MDCVSRQGEAFLRRVEPDQVQRVSLSPVTPGTPSHSFANLIHGPLFGKACAQHGAFFGEPGSHSAPQRYARRE